VFVSFSSFWWVLDMYLWCIGGFRYNDGGLIGTSSCRVRVLWFIRAVDARWWLLRRRNVRL
jgi:hypothetical protein